VFSKSYQKTKIALVAISLILLGFSLWLQPRSAAYETVFYGGTILTLETTNPTAEALLMRRGRIIKVGSLKDVRAAVFGDATEIDLDGKTLMPGLIEPHTHALTAALFSETIDVSGFTNGSRAEIMARLKDGIKASSGKNTIMAFGWDPVMIADLDPPTLAELDALSPTKPLIILTQMMHDAYANSAALKAANITAETPNPTGAEFVKDASGKLTGTVREVAAIKALFASIPPIPASAAQFLLARQYAAYARAGYTTVTTVGPAAPIADPIAVLKYVAQQADTPVRTLIYALPEQLKAGNENTIRPPEDHNTPGAAIGVKFWMDGSPFAGGAAFAEPYENSALVRDRLHLKPGHVGKLNSTAAAFEKAFRQFHNRGYQIAIHTQGERAVKQVLDAATHVLAENPRKDHRHRLEHNALITKAQLQRAKELGFTVSFFADHIYYYGHALNDLVGPARTGRYMPVKTALNIGHRVTVHTDNPATPVGPFRAMQTLRARKSRVTGEVIGPQERLSPIEALQAMTINAAWQLGLDKETGSLKEGKSADLLLLSANPLEVTDDQLQSIEVLGTWIMGQPADTRPLTPTKFKTGLSLMLDRVFH
jgi:predicted amidohydrolase YtcJ